MFEVGFSELVLVAVVALLVLGPERLPRLARVAGMWVGRARRTLATVKQEIDREMKADELNRVIGQQTRAKSLDSILEDWEKTPSKPLPPSSGAAEGSATADAGPTPARGPRDSSGGV